MEKDTSLPMEKVRQKELVNGLGGVGHENTASEGGFLEKIGQGSSMIQVKVSDEKNIDYGRVNLVEIGQSSHARRLMESLSVDLPLYCSSHSHVSLLYNYSSLSPDSTQLKNNNAKTLNSSCLTANYVVSS
ncbi:hypothetical protein GYH30_034011 [Glycine max]|uniref:Uncharacterized protein n=1 Tax=Glycine max TaxID=3847 RepID=A0A0R0H630_SOYBN|nr:hypothetical protein GYH30_034011 [Glycine max]